MKIFLSLCKCKAKKKQNTTVNIYLYKSLHLLLNSKTILNNRQPSKAFGIARPLRLPMWPRFKSRRRRHMWVEFVVASLLCSGRFSLITPVFHSPQKTIFLNSNSTRNQVEEEPLCGCVISKSLFIYFLSKI